jgi:hypothetical protein
VFKRLFPTIARVTEEWPPEKWMVAPVVVMFLWGMIAVIANEMMFSSGAMGQ